MAIEDGAVLTRALDHADSIPDALQLYQRNRVDRTVRIVNQSTANRALFHLRTVDGIRDSFAEAGRRSRPKRVALLLQSSQS